MKKLLLVSLLFCTALIATAQDETIFQPTKVRTYYTNGDTITHIYQFDNTGLVKKDTRIWGDLKSRTTFEYNQQRNIIRSVTPSVDLPDYVTFITDYEYDADGMHMTRKHNYTQLPFSTQTNYIFDYYYNNNKTLDSIIYRRMSSVSSTSKHLYEHYENTTVRTLYFKVNNKWILNENSTLETFVFDDTGKKTRYELESFIDNTAFVKSTATDYEYDSDGRLITITDYAWDGENWMPKHKTERAFNGVFITESVNYIYNNEGFDNFKRSLYEYDDNNNLTEVICQDWSDGAWVDGSMSMRNNIVFSAPYLEKIENLTATADSISKIEILDYVETTSPYLSIDDLLENNFVSLYPNPTNGLVTITGEDIAKVVVTNIIGQTVFTNDCNGDVTIDLSEQPSGIYIFNITDKKGDRCTRKVVKSI